jgi:hypothetical protein
LTNNKFLAKNLDIVIHSFSMTKTQHPKQKFSYKLPLAIFLILIMATFSIFTIAKNLPQKSMKDKEKIVNISTSQQSLSSSYTSSSANSVSSTPSNLLPSSTSGLAVAVPGVNLLNSEDLNIPILMYHHISTTDGIPATDATAIGLRVGPKVFEKQMEKLKAKGYNTISSQQIVDYQYKSVPLPKNPILLTFDDGYKDNFINAFPVLKKLGLKGEFEKANICPGTTPKL